MANLKAVAEHAGVSISTASRVLRGNTKVDPVLTDRVRSSAKAVGYRVNSAARNLRLQTSNVIALIIPDIANPFFTAVSRAVEDVANERGFSVLLCNTDENPKKEADYLAMALQYRVAGAIVAPHGALVDLSGFADDGVPVVGVNRPVNEEWASIIAANVLVDIAAGIRAGVAHFAEQGWTHIAFIAGADSEPARFQAFEDALLAQKVSGKSVGVAFSVGAAARAADELLAGANPPDAFLVGSNPMAIGVLGVIGDRDLVLGTDVGLISVDDAPWAPYVNPPLTVIAQPDSEVGRRAALALFDAIDSGNTGSNATMTLPATLTKRGSAIRSW